MSSSTPIGARWSVIVVPLFLFGCSVAGEGGDDDENENGDRGGCRSNADCRQGRACLDIDGNRDVCEEGEDCACGPAGAGGSGSSTGGMGGEATGGSTDGDSGEGGAGDAGNGTGGSSTGGEATGGESTGGNATGGNATGGRAMGGNTTGGAAGSTMGGSSGAADCGAYCARVVGAMCTAPTQTACLAECNALTADCPAEAPAVLQCVADTSHSITCLSGSPVINGCNPELDARDRCLICLPATGDGTCVTCSKGSCCDENGDFGLAPDAQPFYECATACTTQGCFDGCVRSYPVAGAALASLIACEDMACPEECICEAGASDDDCERCYKASCCAETVDYTLAADLAGFEACALECPDQLCVEDCADEFPEAGAAYRAWSVCIDQECLAECSN